MLESLYNYFIISGITLAVFFLLYKFIFSKTTFFSLNRNYLIGSLIFASVIPFLNFTIPSSDQAAVNNFVIYKIADVQSQVLNISNSIAVENSLNWGAFIVLIYMAGLIFFLLKLIRHFIELLSVISNGERIEFGDKSVVVVDSVLTSFPFFNRIVISKTIFNSKDIDQIVLHEQIHQKQLHSLDLLLVEILGVVQWFNPFVAAYKKSLSEMHEYIADSAVVERGVDELEYQKALVNQQYSKLSLALANPFNQSLLKKRLNMMRKHKSGVMTGLRYLLIVPVAILLFSAFSLEKGIPQIKTGIQLNVPNYPDSEIPKGKPIKEEQLKRISWEFGIKAQNPITGKLVTHGGVDLVAEEGTPVYATASGTIAKAEENKGWGLYVGINHEDAYATFYAHLQKYIVKAGDKVKRGQIIGYVGNTGMSTGPHLHYEVRKNNERLNPADFY